MAIDNHSSNEDFGDKERAVTQSSIKDNATSDKLFSLFIALLVAVVSAGLWFLSWIPFFTIKL